MIDIQPICSPKYEYPRSFIVLGLMNETLFDNEIYDDPYVMLNSRVPRRSVTQKWTYLRSDQYLHR